MRVGVLTEYPSPSVQSGPALHTRYLYDRLRSRGHAVTLMGPDTGSEVPVEGDNLHLYRAVPYPTHPKVKIPMPGTFGHMWDAPRLDVVHSQTNTHMVQYAVWMREMHQTAILNTHTVHLPTHSHFILSDGLYRYPFVRNLFKRWASNLERNFARMYNEGDCLIVQSRHFVDYWRERGVTVPIEVVGRPIDPAKFSRQAKHDPFAPGFEKGGRLVVVSRHDREKSLDKLLKIFDKHIAPKNPKATLTLVGDGHEHDNLKALARTLESRARIHFPGEVSHTNLVDWYRAADLFVYTSVSETFGNVVNEALWCGLPVVALDDKMGVAHQVEHEVNGFLVQPDTETTNEEFGNNALLLLGNADLRTRMGREARDICHERSHPDRVVKRFESIYETAVVHARTTVRKPLSKRSTFAQKWALRRRLAVWSYWNGSLIWLAKLATAVGAGRKVLPPRTPPLAPTEQSARTGA